MAVRPRGAALPGRPRLFAPVAIIVLVLLILAGVFVAQYTNYLWFQEVGHTNVFSTVLKTKLLLFAVFGLLMALVIGVNISVAYRTRPPFRPVSLEQQNLERYRVAIEPFLVPVLVLISVFFGIFAGLSAASRWKTWLLWRNSTSFGVKDAQFHKDISYFTFVYPMQRFALGFVLVVLILSLIAAAVTHYLFGGVRLQSSGERISVAARVHLSVLVGLIVLGKAVAYWLDRYGLAFSTRGVVQGASYTDVHAVLPAKTMLTIIAVICALLFFANIAVRNVLLPAGALALLVVAAIIVGGIYPFIVQEAQVRPNEVAREGMYIQRNIDATRTAYSLDDTSVNTNYPANTTATAAQIDADTGTVPNARILDPNILGPTFKRQQSLRGYYNFNDSLDIDRYTVSGKTQDYVVAARELDQTQLASDQRNWINLHLAYTHGNGFLAAPANAVDADGDPIFTVGQLPETQIINGEPVAVPTTSPFYLENTDIYYGEDSPNYSIVDTKQPEIDGPGSSTAGEATTHYTGPGGIKLDTGFKKLLYALKFREKNILLSSSLTSDSKIMYIRNPRDRVSKVAPFLTLDSDPYPAVVDGQLQWIVDGYTTSDGYPYSQSTQLGDVASDSNTKAAENADVNYIRNSVKATVNAYTGKVNLYAWDETDPVLKTWEKVFPGLVQPKSAISKELEAHFRYPEDLFKVQRNLLAQYHVTDADAFYSKEDFWQVPADPTQVASQSLNTTTTTDGSAASSAPSSSDLNSGPAQPPYYAILQFPGQTQAQFSLTSTFVARGQSNLTAFAAVSSDPADYGKIRVIELPKSVNIEGPGQVANAFETSSIVATALLPLRQSGSDVVLGNLLTLPVADGLLYVEPVFTQAKTGATKFPVYNAVIVSFGGKIAYAPKLSDALDELFGAAASAPISTPTTPPSTTTPSQPSQTVLALTDKVGDLYDKSQADLKAGLFAAYGTDVAQLGQAIDALKAAQAPPTSKASPTPQP